MYLGREIKPFVTRDRSRSPLVHDKCVGLPSEVLFFLAARILICLNMHKLLRDWLNNILNLNYGINSTGLMEINRPTCTCRLIFWQLGMSSDRGSGRGRGRRSRGGQNSEGALSSGPDSPAEANGPSTSAVPEPPVPVSKTVNKSFKPTGTSLKR